MKTALQELIEWLDGWAITHESVRQKATELLEKEREREKMIAYDAWKDGHQTGRLEGKNVAEEGFNTFEQYYNETYGQNETFKRLKEEGEFSELEDIGDWEDLSESLVI